ncbi:riboflavin kinase/FMN adenylyltransferase [Arcanobacterium pluranimalium]|uniref:bifunctional riboflavin kinase/FAD synthetase n=1 Tax=Arcanobacterium pluranimalium TaxID=108028 RepID=UPI0019598AA7|nr:bifunctional riboflavin kinase/FAD synthetase [Arcanobacterium pluranimalium]MBM7825636.1 riboflavin kinase/FMN adenylyltransferase [Arcanobacterium pluranimalium]
MEVWKSPADVPQELNNTVVTIGIFDGVHRGHHAVLAKTVEVAQKNGAISIALTFDPHPRLVHNPQSDLNLVTSLEDRLQRLESAGIDAVYVQHYDLDYAALTPRDFIEKQLVGQLHAGSVVVGEDVRFGLHNSGDGAFLREVGEELGFAVYLLDDLCDDDGRRWSSTWVRELLSKGDVAGAAKVLGRPHRIRGVVQHGFKRGRELGFPTANLTGNQLGEVPAEGVYAGWLVRTVPGTAATVHLPAAISIGNNPQFNGQQRTVEAHVLGRSDLDLYGEEIAIDFIQWLRPMVRCESVDELLEQMDEDLRRSAEVLGVPVARRVDPSSVKAGIEAERF